ncbi:hypothetical protein R3P38DRAFT_3311737 [Favolaschia claudopus]|uniref:NAD-dependent protein deacylase n=1 Tax=Favolaschia claudopus TaxID=2862362 RepID=A0AAW0CCX3_9AGAR
MHDDANVHEDSALIPHIRHLLLNYVVQHITTDYIQLTEQAVVDLWAQYFVEIPTADPASLTLLRDPFAVLTRIHGLGTLPPFQEKFQSTPGAIQHIKSLIKPLAGRLKADRAALLESNHEAYPFVAPFAPILTTRAIRETPKPKAMAPHLIDSLPTSHRVFLSSQTIEPIGVEQIPETAVKQDEVLDTTWQLNPEQHDSVRSLLRAVFTGPSKGHKNRYLNFASRPDSPPISNFPELEFLPIFPRRRRAGSGARENDPPPSGLHGMASLPAVILPPVKVEEIEPQLHRQNMVIVDGWQTLRSSPSPTPSPPSSQEDQIDELFMESPNTTPPPVRPSKIEVVQIPRVKRIGGQRAKPPAMGHGTEYFCTLHNFWSLIHRFWASLATFLLPHVRKDLPNEPPLRASPQPSVSMIGQADPGCDPTADVREDLDYEVAGLYGHRKQDPRDLILREKPDDKRQLLMEVPLLRPPNEHPPNALFLPSSLADLVAPLKVKGQANVEPPPHKFLKKAKGIPSLNVELSWVPIAAQTRIPTSSEVIKVTCLFDEDNPFSNLSRIETLLNLPIILSDSELYSETWGRRYPQKLDLEVHDKDFEVRMEIILSRKERRRAAGLPEEIEDDSMDGLDSTMDSDDVSLDDRSGKRPRLDQEQYFEDSGVAFDDPWQLNFDNPQLYDDYNSLPYAYDNNKENLPPRSDPPYDEPFDLPVAQYIEEFDPQDTAFPVTASQTRQYDPDAVFIDEPREFVALSFESLPIASAPPTQLKDPPNNDYLSNTPPSLLLESNPNKLANDPAVSVPRLTPLPEISSHSHAIAQFAQLRAKKINIIPPPSPSASVDQIVPAVEEHPHSIPDSVYDRNTLRLPPRWTFPTSQHRYMVSMDLVQKQGLIHCFRSRSCLIDLVEREFLGGVDVILDPHTAVMFTNIFVLSSECAELASRIAQQSWCYSRLLVVFEAYPESYSYRSKDTCDKRSELFAYSKPVVKALGKLRRDLGISEGCGVKREGCLVQYAFADTVEEAAIFTRCFGDMAEGNDDESRGAIWGDRTWFEDELPEGEEDLAAVEGMNRFAAYLILCQVDLGDFLELSPEVRVERHGAFVGVERMTVLNEVIERRLQVVQDLEMEPSVPNFYSYTFNIEAKMLEFQQLLRNSKNIIAVCGAGLSAASGIPTFRGAGGMWRKYDAMSLATPEAFAEDPSLVWQFYPYRRERARAAEPNAAHEALAKFSIPSLRKTVVPDAMFTIITQNVDGLSVKAMDKVLKEIPDPKPADISIMYEMHGRLFDVSCTSRFCKHVEYNTDSPICAALAGTEEGVEAGTIDAQIPKEQLPRCSQCKALGRPGVVWFGERPKYMKEIDQLVETADLCLVVGTSSTVYPAAGYAAEVQAMGGKVAVFNLERSSGDEGADYLFLGPCEKTLPEALGVGVVESN